MDIIAATRPVTRDVRYTLALVLAGGRGKRLRGLTRWRVKPAVPFGGKYRIIDFALSNCINSGLRRIGVLTQYKSQSLIRHLSRGWGLLHPELGEFIEILPAQQRLAEKWYSGTADAIYQNLDIIRRYNPEFVLVLAGDHIYKMDYGQLVSFHSERGGAATVVCNTVPLEDAKRFGVMSVDEDLRITAFKEKPKKPTASPDDPAQALVSMGIYVFNAGYLFDRLVEDAKDAKSHHDFGRDIIPRAVAEDHVFAYPFDRMESELGTYWRDVGTVDSYYEANMELIGVTPELNLYDQSWPIRTTIGQYPPAKFVFNDPDRTGHAVDSLVGEGSIISGAYIESSLISKHVRIEDHTTIEKSVILPEVDVGSNCKLRRAIVEKGCILPAGTVAGFDREQDEKRFDVSPGGVTLISPDSLGQELHRVH